MKMEKEFEREMNKQINEELYSAYLYLAISADFESKGFRGFAGWMKVQAKEELNHAMKFYQHLIERGCKVELAEISAPQKEWKNPLTAFEDALSHEKHITARINKLMEMAKTGKDYPSENFLQWFVDEQVEEEATAEENIFKIKSIGDSQGSMLWFDHELGKRGKKE